MTGKEALEEIKYCRAYINELGCEVPLSKIREYKIILKELEELTKYKRVFEILKDKLQFENLGEMQSGMIFRGYFEDCFNEEEYELLEELMKSE